MQIPSMATSDDDKDSTDVKEIFTRMRPSHTPTNSYKFIRPPNFLDLNEVNNRLDDYADSSESDVQSMDSDAIRVQLQEHHDFFQKYTGFDLSRKHSPKLLALSYSFPKAISSKADQFTPNRLASSRAGIQPSNKNVYDASQLRSPSKWEAVDSWQMLKMSFNHVRGKNQRKGRNPTLSKTENHIKKIEESKSQAKVNKGHTIKTRKIKKRWKGENTFSQHRWTRKHALELISSPVGFSTTSSPSPKNDGIDPATSLSEDVSPLEFAARSRSMSSTGRNKRSSSMRKTRMKNSGIIKPSHNRKSRAYASCRTHAMRTRSESLRMGRIFYELDHSGKEAVSIRLGPGDGKAVTGWAAKYV